MDASTPVANSSYGKRFVIRTGERMHLNMTRTGKVLLGGVQITIAVAFFFGMIWVLGGM